MFRTEFLFDGRSFVFHHKDEQDHIFRHLRQTETFYEQAFLEYLRGLIRPGDLVLDVGANIGTHSVFFAAVCGARVIAFEPHPVAQTLFDANVDANGLSDQIRLEPFGAGATYGRASLKDTLAHNLGATRLLIGEGSIFIRPLDSIALSAPPRLIKVDVEGAELEVLKGARQLIAEARPILAFEADTEAELVKIRNALEPLGYLGIRTLNYTPTVIFVPCEDAELARHTALMASNALSALSYLARTIDRTGRDILNGQSQQTTTLSSGAEALGQQFLAKSVAAFEASRGVLERLMLAQREAILDETRSLGHALTDFRERSDLSIGRVDALLQEMRRGIECTLDAITNKVASDAGILQSSIHTEISSAVEAVADHVVRDGEARLQTLRLSFDGAIEDIAGRVSRDGGARLELLQAKLDGAVEALTGQFTRNGEALADRITRQFDATATEISSAVEAVADHVVRDGEARLQTLRLSFDGAIEDIAGRVSRDGGARLELLQAKLDGAVEALTGQFTRNGEALADQITRQFDATVDNLVASELAAREALNADILHHVKDVERQLFELRSDIKEIRESLRRSLEPLGSSLAGQMAAVVAEIAPMIPAPTAGPARLADDAGRLDGSLICFYARRFCEGWAEWRFEQSVRLDAGGGFTVNQATSTPGLRSTAIALPCNGLYRVDGRWRLQPGAEQGAWIIRVSDPASGELLHSATPIADGAFSLYFYVPHRVSAVEISVLASKPSLGLAGWIDEVRLSKVDETRFQASVSKRIGAPVIASLASLPARVSMMRDAVASLLLQCDEVRVFLNGYTEVPSFLDHPRVTIRRSQDYDDNGDAGKFQWIEADDPPGYRIIGDDDLLYPPDLVQTLVARVRENSDRAMVGLHGIIIRQPVAEYYAPSSRYVVHFQSALREPKLVHVLATCVMCAHSTAMPRKFATFMHRNMADIWLAKHAQEHAIPLIAIERAYQWVRENKQDSPYETIYDNSLNRTSLAFNTSNIQSSVLKAAWPLTIPAFGRLIGLMIFQIADATEIQEDIRRFHATRRQDHDWKTVIVLISDDAAQRAALEAVPFREELHIVAAPSHEAASAELGRLLPRLTFDIGYYKGSGLDLVRTDWCHDAVDIARSYNIASAGFRRDGNRFRPVVSGEAADFALFTSAEFAGSLLSDGHELIARLLSASVATAREASSPGCWPPAPEEVRGRRPAQLRNFFDRVVVLNLDRRPDRFAWMRTQLAELGIEPIRQRAVDGTWPEVRTAYLTYFAQDLCDTEALPPLTTTADFYLRAVSEAQRTAYIEQKVGRKAIATPGAWGYLQSLIQILEQAIVDNVETLLVLDDDVTFHKDAAALFEVAVAELPNDWKILQLGSLQYDWDSRYVRWRSLHLYSQRGAAIGSHAVGLHRDVLPFLLERARRCDMPYDIGALSAATRAFPDQNFVIFPNIAIQSVTESEIGTSEFQRKTRDVTRIYETYRWTANDYVR